MSRYIGWWFLLVAAIWDIVIPFILAPFYHGYSHRKMVMSSLGNPRSPVKLIYNIWLVVLGFVLSYGAITIFDAYKDVSQPLSLALAVLIVLFAVGACILSGCFSVNESKSIETSASKIHGFGSVIGFIALLFAPLLLSILSFRNNDIVSGIVCMASFVFSLISFTLFVMSDKSKFQKTIIANEGLWQRLTLAFMYLPIAYISICNIH